MNNTTNNKFVVEQHINVFGKESIGHISQQQIQALLADPVNAVPQFIKLKHRKAPGGVNQNVSTEPEAGDIPGCCSRG